MEEKLKTIIIILAAGNATRLRPLSERIPKPLIKINGKTIISRIITSFTNSGFNRFIVLVGYKSELVKKEVLRKKGIQVDFVEQTERTGMADGILLCINYINEYHKEINNYFVTAADIIFSKKEILKMYGLIQNRKANIILSLMRSQDKRIGKGHANVKLTMDGFKITDIIEKPSVEQILSEFYSLPLYIFNNKISYYLENIEVSERGEKEFQDAIKEAINNKEFPLGINIIDELISIENIGAYHLTYLKDIIGMNLRFLDRSQTNTNLIIGEGSEIGINCYLVDTVLFENVRLGDNVNLENCIVDKGIILKKGYKAKDCFLTYDKKGNLNKIEF